MNPCKLVCAERMARYDALDPLVRKTVRESPWDLDVAHADKPEEIIEYVKRRWAGTIWRGWGARHPDVNNKRWLRA